MMKLLNSIFIASYIALTSLFSTSACEANITGFTMHLIHRDSPQSPFYDPSLCPTQRIVNALERSFNRAQRFKARHSPELYIIPAGGEYLMEYSIGTQPVPSLGIASTVLCKHLDHNKCFLTSAYEHTGSDLIWTQCQPCLQCFKQFLPIFSPLNSSTYKRIPCDNPKCRYFPVPSCSRTKTCIYSEAYADGSFTRGEVATDTLTLTTTDGKPLSIPNIELRCAYNNKGIFSGIESGIVGLGGGKPSLVKQLGPLAQDKFSYCLVSLSDGFKSSKLSFGANADVSGSDVVSTRLVTKDQDTFYFVTMEGISYGNQRLDFSDSGYYEEGNLLMDSGTTLTYLPPGLYAKLEKAIKSSINLKQIPGPSKELRLCYFWTDDVQIHIPKIIVHFKGADLKLKQENIFTRTSDTSMCLAVAPMDDDAIYGNIAQRNFMVGYDLQKKTVSFKPTDCGNY